MIVFLFFDCFPAPGSTMDRSPQGVLLPAVLPRRALACPPEHLSARDPGLASGVLGSFQRCFRCSERRCKDLCGVRAIHYTFPIDDHNYLSRFANLTNLYFLL